MLSRRLLRIKVMQVLYGFFQNENKDIQAGEKELFYSIFKSYELYHYLMLLAIDLKFHANGRLERFKTKKNFDEAEAVYLSKLTENKVLCQLENNKPLKKFLNDYKFSWVDHPDLIKTMLDNILNSSKFLKYCGKEVTTYNEDKKTVVHIFTDIISETEELYTSLEEQSIYWNDDIEFIISMIIKTIDKFKEGQSDSYPLASMYKSKDDITFVQTLFRKAVLKHEDNTLIINKFVRNWEMERIAFIDTLLMEMALVEALELDDIPTRVTLNEYIEMAKYYSTPKSSTFINGVLDSVFIQLKKDEKIQKRGKGLVGENKV